MEQLNREEKMTHENTNITIMTRLMDLVGGSEMVELVIKINEHEVNKECGLCKKVEKFRTGPQLFRADNWRLVCYSCGGEHKPELSEIIPEVREYIGYGAYLDSMERLRELKAKGELEDCPI